MSLLSLLQAYRSYITLSLVIFGPSLLPRLLSFFLRRPSPSRHPVQPRPPLSNLLKGLLAVHSAYYAFQLLLPPFDLFISNHLPLTAPNTVLRQTLLGPTLPSLSNGTLAYPLQELLLQKLQNIDNRFAYARFGHGVMTDCVWCSHLNDYTLFAVPSIILPYIVEVIILGIMGWKSIGGAQARSRSNRWRTTFGWVLLGLAAGEIGVKYGWEMRIVAGDSLHLASTVHTLRSIVLLFLPIAYAFLPLPPSSPHPATLIPVLINTQNTLRLAALARSATRRGVAERRLSQAVRQDPGISRAVQEAGLDVGSMREGARRWLRDGWDGLIKVEGSTTQ